MTSSATRDARTADYSQHSKADLVQLLAHVLGDDANAIKKLSKGDLIANLAMKMDCPSGDFDQWIVDDRENQDAVMEEEKKAADATAVENYLAENGDDEEESDKSDDEEKPAKASKKHKADVEREAPNRKKPKVDSVEKKSDSLAKKKASASIFGSESKSPADGTDELGEAEPMVPLGIISSFVALLYFVAVPYLSLPWRWLRCYSFIAVCCLSCRRSPILCTRRFIVLIFRLRASSFLPCT